MNAKRLVNPSQPDAAGSEDERVWHALHDASRRDILDLLRQGPMTTGALCGHFNVTRFAVMKHLKVLHGAGLISIERRGRTRLNHLNPMPIQQIYRRWIKPFEAMPADRMLRLKHYVEQSEES